MSINARELKEILDEQFQSCEETTKVGLTCNLTDGIFAIAKAINRLARAVENQGDMS